VRIGVGAALLAVTALAACGGEGAAASRARDALSGRLQGEDHDPCTLLTAEEASPYVGVLVAPPYRASEGVADARGDECMYRGKDGRQVAVRPVWTTGRLVGRVLHDVPTGLGKVLDRGAPGWPRSTV